ncbi:LITAF-like zinc ribbon domain-containing protein [Phthorimaea operculella]|nr:LITAF-like zinc ribbon domain-containing protein [Phthorimaea operculella]
MINKSFQSERIATSNDSGQSMLNTPDSLTSAPPSYSFVLRQTAAMARRRPRHMGTFIPSPSFVTKTPPPNYAQAFDIYVDTPVRHTHRHRVNYTFGFAPMPVICPECGYTGLTTTQSKITLCTHLCALLLCLFCCWVCAPLPYIMSSCKDVYHYCGNCNALLGMYSPSNPEPTYTMR